MSLVIGQIYEGCVKGIANYGAFVEVQAPGEARPVTGMVHISEVANTFVRDIHDVLSEGDTVQIMVIGANAEGKLSFSIKKAAPPQPAQEDAAPRKKRGGGAGKPRVYEPKRSVPQSEMSFEDKLLHFKQASEEKICDLRRGSERRGGSRSRRS